MALGRGGEEIGLFSRICGMIVFKWKSTPKDEDISEVFKIQFHFHSMLHQARTYLKNLKRLTDSSPNTSIHFLDLLRENRATFNDESCNTFHCSAYASALANLMHHHLGSRFRCISLPSVRERFLFKAIHCIIIFLPSYSY